MFYKNIGITINIDNYKKLFMAEKKFVKQYGVTKQQLIEKYNYDEYKEKKNDRII